MNVMVIEQISVDGLGKFFFDDVFLDLGDFFDFFNGKNREFGVCLIFFEGGGKGAIGVFFFFFGF